MITHVPQIIFGADPEFFFERSGAVIGAERVIERELETANTKPLGSGADSTARSARLVLDGVQVELHPHPSICRAGLALAIANGMRALKQHLAQKDYRDIKASFKTVVEVPEDELASLSEAARKLGCAPSLNVHKKASVELEGIDAGAYRKRAAGGHIHLGTGSHSLGPWSDIKAISQVRADRDRYPSHLLVPLLDIFVGNTCVLIDRDEGQVERRKLYGRAGEFREPPYGVEYRTLSNFWLRSGPLVGLVTGLSRLACAVLYAPGRERLLEQLRASIDLNLVTEAINENDEEKARKTWEVLKGFVRENVDEYLGNTSPIVPSTLDDFEYFISKGLDHWFPQDPLEYWQDKYDFHGTQERPYGWETFLYHVVRKERAANGN